MRAERRAGVRRGPWPGCGRSAATNSKGGKALLADFEAIAFNGRAVGFIFDSDV
jgi:hypothetical protein